MIGGDRPGVRIRELAGDERRRGVPRRARDRGGVPEPRALGGEPGQVGEQLGVDRAVLVDDRRQRELVEHEHDHRDRVADVAGAG